ncbi:MAG: hypothetical protein CL499_03040 [Actinobacteria bacterium]|nr:hypothetical protein [Actinomycetota bacterium]|tara:strand:+ start:513 stop:968 length:456 start_codon:yes stop_codon:yes gene_type:complete
MKKIFLILSLIFISNIQSQENNRSDLIGKWEFKIDVKDVIKNSKELSAFEKIGARMVSGLIEKTLEKTQMIFDFKNDNTASITIITKEKTESKNIFKWELNNEGRLLLDSVSNQQDIEFGDTAYWIFEDDKLIPYDKKDDVNLGILMIKLK